LSIQLKASDGRFTKKSIACPGALAMNTGSVTVKKLGIVVRKKVGIVVVKNGIMRSVNRYLMVLRIRRTIICKIQVFALRLVGT
jgi:hypothetical protein